MLKSLALKIGSELFGELSDKYGGDLKKVAIDYFSDTLESAVVGKRTLDEWAEIVIVAVDKIIDKTIRENDYEYVGGTLNFSLYKISKSKVIISYELYFKDKQGAFFKKSANSDVNRDNFIEADLQTLENSGGIAYEVKG